MLGGPDALATRTEIQLNAVFGAPGRPIGPREN